MYEKSPKSTVIDAKSELTPYSRSETAAGPAAPRESIFEMFWRRTWRREAASTL
jgi:hypothetical protein